MKIKFLISSALLLLSMNLSAQEEPDAKKVLKEVDLNFENLDHRLDLVEKNLMI